jgi:hypothetical protein
MPTLTRLTAMVFAVTLLAGCAPVPPISKQDAVTEANLLKFAGPPIDSFTYLGRYDGFRTLGDMQVVIFTTINDAYLIRVLPPCINLRTADRVGLTSSNKTVNRTFDFVLADHERCRIDTIRHVDYAAVKRARSAGAG